VNPEDYTRRQRVAMRKLRKMGLYRAAQDWLPKHFDSSWKGTPLEYALAKMPRLWLLRFFGL